MKRLALLLLLAGIAWANESLAQNVAICAPGATGTWGTIFLPCSVNATFVPPAQLVGAPAIAVQRAAVNEWLPFANLAATDMVWTDTVRPNTTSQWWPIAAVPNFPALGGSPVTPPPVTPPPSTASGSVTVSWTLATLNTDGSALTGLTGTLLRYGSSDFSNSLTVPAPAISTVIPGQPAGPFQVQALTVTSGGTSDPSATATGTVKAPSPPGAPSVQTPTATLKTTGTAVYLVTNIPNGFAVTQVGTVPVGSPCLAGQGVDQYNTVDQTQVTPVWATAIQPLNVVSLCQ